MKVVGLIAEYNPFHNGHLHHITKAKELTGADYAVVIMSGDYVQRGVPAIMPKRLRTEMALKSGASAVFELPVCYATGSAELFAEGAVSFFDHLGVVDSICFGSECNDLDGLQTIADVLLEEPEEYRVELRKHLKNGVSYPHARQAALSAYMHIQNYSLLNNPNNILGIEYLKALKKLNSSMKPYTIKRHGAHYHDETLHPVNSSASAIRSLLAYSGSMVHTESPETFENSTFHHLLGALEDQVPSDCLELLKDYHRVKYPVYQNDFSLLLKYKLLNKTPETLTMYMDVSPDLANRISGQLNNYFNYKQYCELLKTRELTQTRINRSLLHIMLGIKKDTVTLYLEEGAHAYAHLLGFRKDSEKVISAVAKQSRIPLLTKLYDTDFLSDTGRRMLTQDILASNLYNSVVTDKYKTAYENEYHQAIIKV
ncbi:nucleotidyltransferase [Mediterraneibacter agrestimuris]|uniref:nucleotidyltransferase n=1 Tax=Mediterraneibacter agrestimuris TaxID=2941333 RepID=UPI002040AA9E|nr:nucleotidyltransferase [Mediterraneibacter agrestimuris]